jgi:DHA1 family arabinose polymer transporter-like MFS transporter
MKKSLVTLALGGLSIGTTEFIMMGLLPDIAKEFHITIPQAGHLISAYALGVVIGAPLLVAISSSYPPKKILMVLMGVFVIFNGLSALATGNVTMLIARLLSGLPHGAFFGVGSVVASRLAEKHKLYLSCLQALLSLTWPWYLSEHTLVTTIPGVMLLR